MLKKFRLYYWKKRDQGKGKQVLLKIGLVLLCFVILIVCWIVNTLHCQKFITSDQTVSGSAVSGTSVSGSAASGASAYEMSEAVVEDDNLLLQEEISSEETETFRINTEGLSPFLSFMTDHSYEQMVSELTKECEIRGASSAKMLEYQKVNNFAVTSYILASDESVWCVTYNLKADAVTLKPTSLSESDVVSMKKEADEEEQQKLEKERKAKKKAAKPKKKTKKKTKKDVG